MKVNVPQKIVTHNGAQAVSLTPYERLRRTVLACMLFENNFYEDGISVAERITQLCSECNPEHILSLAHDAAIKQHIRHVPLQLIVEILKQRNPTINAWHTIRDIITRPDMMTDLVALYWKDGKKPLPHQLKRGIAAAFHKFDEYQFAKYNRDDPVKLRDVMFLCHPKPMGKEHELFKKIANCTLQPADTWENRLCAGASKKETFTELLTQHKMGKLAILRNMRQMHAAGISKELVSSELHRSMKEMLPFQYLAAARSCPAWEDIIDSAMIESAALKPKLVGNTVILVDVSGSMMSPLASSKPKKFIQDGIETDAPPPMAMIDAACGLAILLRECCDNVQIYTFSDGTAVIPSRHGMALRDVIINSQPHQSTYLGMAVNKVLGHATPFDRFIVITDEQSSDVIPNMPKTKNYILNVGNFPNGIGNKNQWLTITGFSEACIDYIRIVESESNE